MSFHQSSRKTITSVFKKAQMIRVLTQNSYKTCFEMEDYLQKLPKKHRETLCQFRCVNLKLPLKLLIAAEGCLPINV